MSLITTMTVFLLYFRKNPMWTIFLPAFLWQFVYQLGAHSRTSALMAAVGLLFATLFGRRVPATVMALVMALCLFSSLEGRSSGLNGISQVPRVFEHAYNGATKNLGEVMANSGEGIFSVTETWVYRPKFTNRYVYNSFSPLVSAIDGWDKISDSDEIPLALYAPMSAVEELFSFGIGFVILYFATQFYASYVTNKAINKKPGMLPLVLNAMVAMGFMQEWAYSVRSGYRFYLYALAGCAFL